MQNDYEDDDDAVTYGHIGTITQLSDKPMKVPKREFPPGFDLRPTKRREPDA